MAKAKCLPARIRADVSESPSKRKAFLEYYAGVLTREADARPGQDCQWMRDGALRALREAGGIDVTPAQADLFGGAT